MTYTCSVIYTRQDLEAARVPISRLVDKKKLWCIYTMEYYLATKKKETLPFVTAWMNGPGEYYAK